MASILDLPPELLEDILALLKLFEISFLSRTCKALYNYLQPHVYHTIDWYWKDENISPPFHLLLRTLVANRRLANSIRVIKFRGGGIVKEETWAKGVWDDGDLLHSQSIWDLGNRTRAFLDCEKEQHVHQLLSRIAWIDPIYWTTEFERGSVDVFVGLILYHTQHLRNLEIGHGYTNFAKFIPWTFKQLTILQKFSPVYPHLTSVSIAADGTRTPRTLWVDIDMFRLFMFLPRLQHLNTVLMEPIVFAWPSPTMIPKPGLMTTLTLRKTTVPPSTLQIILKDMTGLKHLVYDYTRFVACGWPHWECEIEEWDDRHGYRLDRCVIHLNPLTKALSSVAKTLKILVLRMQFESDYWGGSEILHHGRLCGFSGRIRGLQLMPNLTIVEIPWALLFGWTYNPYERQAMDDFVPLPLPDSTRNPWTDLLPSQIETLRITNDGTEICYHESAWLDYIPLVEELLACRRELYGDLNRIDFVFRATEDKTLDRVFSKCSEHDELTLRALCSEEGVATTIVREIRYWN